MPSTSSIIQPAFCAISVSSQLAERSFILKMETPTVRMVCMHVIYNKAGMTCKTMRLKKIEKKNDISCEGRFYKRCKIM